MNRTERRGVGRPRGFSMSAESIRKRLATMFRLYGMTGINGHEGEIKMVVSDWYMDTDGLMTRTIRQANE